MSHHNHILKIKNKEKILKGNWGKGYVTYRKTKIKRVAHCSLGEKIFKSEDNEATALNY